MKAFLRKLPGGLWRADDEEGVEALSKIPSGKVIRVEWHQPRNYRFHKKFFAMLKVGYDAWEPQEAEFKGMPVQKNFDRFRDDVLVAAGYWKPVVNIKGEVRADPDSISFGNMDEETFGKVYNDCANVLLQRILKHYTKDDSANPPIDDLEAVVQQMMGFMDRGEVA